MNLLIYLVYGRDKTFSESVQIAQSLQVFL